MTDEAAIARPRDRYSLWRLIGEGFRGHKGWRPAWTSPEPAPAYDAIVIGGGGHGLATAYYLARNHGLSRVAVLEKGWIGGGNSGRNTTIVRSNYYYPQSAALYDFALKLYERLSHDLNYNIMLSQRGILFTTHSRHDLESATRWVGAMQANGVDAEILDRAAVARLVPAMDMSDAARFPVNGGYIQRRGGTARHDAVVWGYARAASALGVDIIENCEVHGFEQRSDGRIVALDTSRGRIAAPLVGMAVAGHSSEIARRAGLALPITSYALQAFVTEPLKPVLDTAVLSLATGLYVSQSDKGGLVFGGGLDLYPSYAQRGNLPVARSVITALAAQYPSFSRVRLVRQWAGIVDIAPDSSPILGASPVPGLFLNCGWGTGGFKSIPAGGYLLAHHMATGRAHPLAAPFALDRFRTGALIDEAAASGIPH